MTNSYNFCCINCTCGAKSAQRMFIESLDEKKLKTDQNDMTKITCPNDKKVKLKLMGQNSNTAIIDPTVHAKGRQPQERESRRIKDFIKNTLPTLSRADKQHFTKKFTKKGFKVKEQ